MEIDDNTLRWVSEAARRIAHLAQYNERLSYVILDWLSAETRRVINKEKNHGTQHRNF